MSRNIRLKFIVPSAKKRSRKNSRATDTSDDDYGGVDLISDSEEDEPDVEEVEEQAIIDSAEEADDDEDDNDEDEDDDDDLQNTPRPSQDDDHSSWNGFEPESEEDLGIQHNPFFDEQYARTHPSVDALFTQDDDAASPTRRVRFDLADSDSADSEDDIDALFPDIFLPQDRLDPTFRRLIEKDEGQESSSDDSYWDINNSDDNSPSKVHNTQNSSESEESDSSGYDSEGETTDEDLPPAARFAPARTVLRRPSEEDESEAEEEINPRRGPIRSRYPKISEWKRDPTKAFAIIGKSKNLIFYKAVKRRHSVNDATMMTPRSSHSQELDSPQAIFSADVTPMISNSANLMMSAMSNTPYDDLFHGQAIGPSEAFFPFTSIEANGTIYQNIDDYEYDEDDFSAADDALNLEHYIDFDDDSSDDENADCDDPTSVSQSATEGGMARPTTATSEDQVHPLLNHFDSGVVGAFRKNQTRHQLLSRNAESHASLAFHGPNRPVRGIKGGRLEAANTPITPLRKQKMRPLNPPVDSSPLAHLTGGGIEDKKRKFDMEEAVRGHKRTRSLI